MSVKGINSIESLLSTNSYPGRGIIIGESADGKNAMIAYFIMGVNSLFIFVTKHNRATLCNFSIS